MVVIGLVVVKVLVRVVMPVAIVVVKVGVRAPPSVFWAPWC